jgi:TonB family protein
MTEPRSGLIAALLLACAVASVQAAPEASAAASAAERAQKETDRTMYWIRVLADKPAPVKVAPKPATVPTPPAKAAPDAREKVKGAAAAVPAGPTAANADPAPAALGRGLDPAQTFVGNPSDPAAHGRNGAGSPGAAGALAPHAAAVPLPPAEPDPGLTQIKSVRPEFPLFVVSRVRKGNVEVQFEVEPGGQVVDAIVVNSSNHKLNDAALEAVRQWRFAPGPKGHTAAVNLVFDIDKEK